MSIPIWESLVASYESAEKWHGETHADFTAKVLQTDWMWKHRQYCDDNKLGMGDHAFHYMWWLICQQMPESFKFLEIGVYRGQVTSWVSLCAERLVKSAYVMGITPEELEPIYALHIHFDSVLPSLLREKSQSEKAFMWAHGHSPFDIVYIDGSHAYGDVVSDINNYGNMLRKDGLLVMDDASCYLNMPPHIWTGHNDVAMAVRDTLEGSPEYKHLMAIGHNRIFRRIV